MRMRTRARELALQFLYQVDLQGPDYGAELKGFLERTLEERSGAPEARAYAVALVEGVIAHRDEIDALLREAARNWELERMAAIDRNALRIGTFELLYVPEIPMRVAINEAIELAKRYSTEASGAFVNGILDRIRKDRGVA